MARLAGKFRGDLRALEEQRERKNPIKRGSGATPSSGLSKFRGGGDSSSSDSDSDEEMVGGGHIIGGSKKQQDDFEARVQAAFREGQLAAERDAASAHAAAQTRMDTSRVSPADQSAARMLMQMKKGKKTTGGNTNSDTGAYRGKGKSEAREMGRRLGVHVHKLHGAGFWDDFKQGFSSAASAVAPLVGLIPHPAAQIGSKVLEGIGSGMPHMERAIGSGRERDDRALTGLGKCKRAPAGPNDGRRKRAEVVKKVMAERGLSMIEASKFVKAHNLY